jgi:hypothetical protein
MKVASRINNGSVRTRGRNVSEKLGGGRGAIGRIDAEAVSFDDLGGRGKARRDARAAKKVNKQSQPTKKERKGIKAKAKASAKTTKAKAKVAKAENNTGEAKIKGLDTLNKLIDTGAGILGVKTDTALNDAPDSGKQNPDEDAAGNKKKFNFFAWYMILIYLAIIGLILWLVFKKK